MLFEQEEAQRVPPEPHGSQPTPEGVAPGCQRELSEDEGMLLAIRDTLYEGSWEDFLLDLRERLSDRPYVFDVHPASPRLKDTMRRHLEIIEQLSRWERDHGVTLHGEPESLGKTEE